MAQVTLEDAKKVAKKVVEELDPEAIILFGSIARQGYGNDLDLLIIKNDQGKTPWDCYREVDRTLEPFFHDFSIDFFVSTPSRVKRQFLKGSPFLRLIQREGKSLYMKESFPEWIHQAKDDLEVAELLFTQEHYRACCYHAQQALEKAMKALLLQKGWELEKTHSIRQLITFSERYELSFQLPPETVALLDSVYRGRYPPDEGLLPTGDPTRAQAQSILSMVQSFFSTWKI